MTNIACQGDIGAPITAILKAKNSAGALVVIPLDAGADTVRFTFFFGSGLRFQRKCLITDGPNGVVQYTPIAGDIPLTETTARLQAQITRVSPAQNICTDDVELIINRKF